MIRMYQSAYRCMEHMATLLNRFSISKDDGHNNQKKKEAIFLRMNHYFSFSFLASPSFSLSFLC